jgi:hypothetical protein
MTQEVLPEIQVATEAIESRIAITEGEVAQMNEGIAAKRELLRSQRKALTTINPKRAAIKKRGTGNQRKAAASVSNQSD